MNDESSPPIDAIFFEMAARQAAGVPAFELDEHIAVAIARRDVNAAHGYHRAAESWNTMAITLADVRQLRADHAREVEELTGPPPPTTRRLTPEELAEGEGDER